MKKTFFFLYFVFTAIEGFAQVAMVYRFEQAQDSIVFNKILQPVKNVADTSKAVEILRGYLKQLHKQAYLEASFDSLFLKDSFLIVKSHIGNRYEWVNLRTENVPNAFILPNDFKKKKQFNPSEIAEAEEKLLIQAENNGYPFAQVWLDSIGIQNGQVSAVLMVKTGALFQFDTLNVEGFARISPNFLQHYLDIKRGTTFNRLKLLQISQRLAELPFLQERRKPTLTFKENHTVSVNLLLDSKKASRWDFLVGILPNTTLNGSQKFTITFNGSADFQNLLGQGERIVANFENLRPQSPRLNLKVTYPYLLNSPFGFDGAFDLYKRDSLYIETNLTLGTQYYLGGANYLKLFWNRYNANNLIINKQQIILSKTLPTTLDIATNTFGLEWAQQHLDYRFNPRRGWSFLLRGGAGVRKVQKNADILNLKDDNNLNFNFSKLYDTVASTSFQYKIDTKSDVYLPVFKRSVVKLGVQSGWLFTTAPISLNEQYRIGGNKILRGFNEESTFATQYVVGTLEYRLLIGRNSYLYAFGDLGYVANITRTTRQFDAPLGFGAGIIFETKVGLFGFTLAAGREKGNAVDLRNTKTHFGYVSLF